MPCLIKVESGIYYVVSSLKGKRKWHSLRTRDKEEAYRLFLDLRPSKPQKNQPQRLDQSIAEYLEHVGANFAPKTRSIYALVLKQFRAFAGNIDSTAVTTKHVDQFKIGRSKQASPATVNLDLRALRAFFNCLKRWEVIARNPCEGVREIRVPARTPPYLSEEETGTLLKAITEEWLRDLVAFAAMTGLRLGENLGLRWEDVNLVARTAIIQSGDGHRVKTGKIRVIPLSEAACRILARKSSRQGLIFPGKRGGKANGNFVGRKLRKAVKAAGLDRRLHFHSLRHTFASILVQKGISLYQVQKLLGHSSPRVTQIYAHLDGSNLHDLVEEIRIPSQEVFVGSIGDPAPSPMKIALANCEVLDKASL